MTALSNRHFAAVAAGLSALLATLAVALSVLPRPHPAHFGLDEALSVVARLKPGRCYFTHIGHALSHEATNRLLPKGKRAGVLTISASTLTPAHLQKARVPEGTPIGTVTRHRKIKGSPIQ